MIKELTKEQTAKFPEYVKKWKDIGLSLYKEGDEAKAEEAIKLVYECGGLPPPKTILWADSPYAGAKLAASLNPGTTALSHLSNAGYGSQDASWLSTYDFLMTECGVKNCEKLLGLIELSKSCGWFYPYDTTVILTRKPTVVNLVNGRLHKDLGPAISYKDGYSVYSLNGIRMPKHYVMSTANELSVIDVMKESNVDIRREVLRKIGLERFVKETKAKVVDTMVLETPVQAWPNNMQAAYKKSVGSDLTLKIGRAHV